MNKKIWLHYRNPKDFNFRIVLLQMDPKDKMKAVVMISDSGFKEPLRDKARSFCRPQIQNSNKMENNLNNVCIFAIPTLLSP